MKALRYGTSLLVLASFLVIQTSWIPTAEAAKVVKWKWVHSLISSDFTFIEAQKTVQRIGDRTNGNFKIQLLASGQHPYKGGDILGVVKDNLAQLGETEDVYVSSTEPLLGAMMLPFYIGDMNDAYEIIPKLKEKIFEPLINEKYNSSIIMDFLIVGECVHADEFLDNFDALKGKKIRVWNKETSDLIKLIGGNPVTVSYSELYSALQTGVIDGALTAMDGAWAANLYETVKYVTWWDFAFPWDFTVVNNEAYAKLPEEYQQILTEEMDKTSEILREKYKITVTTILLQAMYKYNVSAKAITPDFRSEIQKRCKPIIDEWIKRAGPKANEIIKIIESTRKK